MFSLKFLIVCWMLSCVVEGTSAPRTFDNVTTIADIENKLETLKPLSCQFITGLTVGNRMRELQCCNETVTQYYLGWSTISLPLTGFLETLRQWNCPQFNEQCENRVFAFTDYSRLVYDYFCNNNTLIAKCLPRVIKIISSAQNRLNYSNTDTSFILSLLTFHNSTQTGVDLSNSVSAKRWKNAISQIQPSRMTLDELLEPCIQVAQYDQEEVHNGSYQEIVNFLVPTCQLTWCGFSGETFRDHVISFWTCLSTSCQNRILLFLAIFGIMAILISVLNLLVILVLSLTPRLHNSQSTYKISLASADLLVGVFVLPTCMYTLSTFLGTRLTTDITRNVTGYQVSNGSIMEVETTITRDIHANVRLNTLTLSYRNAVGFMTGVSIFVSVYTLAAAGFDRLAAVYKPLSYDKVKANKIAKVVCVTSWILAAVFAILPIIATSAFGYGVVFSTIVVSLLRKGIILYIVLLIIPLLIVWIVNISVYVVIKKHTNNFQKKLVKHSQAHRNSRVEKRLAATLRLMVGVFTLNTLPIWITFLCNIFLPHVHGIYPESLSPKVAADFITVQFVAVILLYGNSLCNFCIYNIRNEEFRHTLIRLMKVIFKKLQFTDCCQASGDWFRNVWPKRFFRRKLSSVSISILNLRKKSSSNTTEEMVIEKTSSTSKARKSNTSSVFEIEKTDISTDGKKNRKRQISELPSISEQDDSVFQSFSPDVGVNRFFSSVMRKLSDNVEPKTTSI